MATQFDTVLAAEISNFVSWFPVPLAFLRMNHTGFHVVLSRNAVELLLHQRDLLGLRDVTLVHCHTYHKVILIGILKGDVLNLWPAKLGTNGQRHGTKCHQNNLSHKYILIS